MKVRLVEWRLHELGDLELERLPTDTFEYQGLAFMVETLEFGGRVTLALRRKDDGSHRSLIDFHLGHDAERELEADREAEKGSWLPRGDDVEDDDATNE